MGIGDIYMVFLPNVFNLDKREAVIFELTCPWDSNIQRSHDFKEQKYAALVGDLSRDFKVSLFSVEVSARGQISKANRARLKCFAHTGSFKSVVF